MLTIFEGKFVLLKQYRHAIRSFQYGFPRGFGEEGISAEDNVRKELEEELEAEVRCSELLGAVVADSGVLGNNVSIFKCEIANINLKSKHEGIVEVLLLSEEELSNWIAAGKISDGFTLSAFCLYKNVHSQ